MTDENLIPNFMPENLIPNFQNPESNDDDFFEACTKSEDESETYGKYWCYSEDCPPGRYDVYGMTGEEFDEKMLEELPF